MGKRNKEIKRCSFSTLPNYLGQWTAPNPGKDVNVESGTSVVRTFQGWNYVTMVVSNFPATLP